MTTAPVPIPPGWTAERAGGTFSLQSEDTVFWTFTVLPDGPPPGEAVDAALSALREEYEDVDESPAAGPPLAPGEVAREVGFFCLDDTAAAGARAFRVGGTTYLIYYQGGDRDVDARRDELTDLGRRAWLGVAAAAGPDPVGRGGDGIDPRELPPVLPR